MTTIDKRMATARRREVLPALPTLLAMTCENERIAGRSR